MPAYSAYGRANILPISNGGFANTDHCCIDTLSQGRLEQQVPAYGSYGGGRADTGRQARALDEAAEAYATETRRLPPSPEADALAGALEGLRHKLASHSRGY